MTREEAREFLLSIANKLGDIGVEDLTDRDGKRMIEAIKALEEQPKIGKWIIDGNPNNEWYKVICSECYEDITSVAPIIGFFPNCKVIWDFCPYCGAMMKEGD